MRSTVIGVYDDRSQAQAAIEELVSAGFGRKDIQLVSAEEAQAADESQAKTGHSNDSENGAGTSGSGRDVNLVFRSLFGGEYGGSSSDQDYHGDIYSEAVRRGGYVLAVQSGNDEQHAEIINIMDRFNPIDIDDRVAGWRAQGWSGRGSAGMAGETRRDTLSSSSQPVMSSGQTFDHAAVAGDASANEVSPLADRQTGVYQSGATTAAGAALGGQNASSSGIDSDRRSRVRVFPYGSESEATSLSSQRGNVGSDNLTDNQSLSDDDFRSHWQSNYGHLGGRYEDHDPAYQYGSRLASDERYSNYHQWNDVESNARTDWEAQHAGHPWEKAKDAVRYSWEKRSNKARRS
jgi:hypothetical protein